MTNTQKDLISIILTKAEQHNQNQYEDDERITTTNLEYSINEIQNAIGEIQPVEE